MWLIEMEDRQWDFTKAQFKSGLKSLGNEFGIYAKCNDCRVLCKVWGVGVFDPIYISPMLSVEKGL